MAIITLYSDRHVLALGLEQALGPNHRLMKGDWESLDAGVAAPGNGFNARVVRTLLVGDEPRDVVFAGPHRSRAFVTTAHRGQNMPASPGPQLTTEGVGRSDVWVFNATNLSAAPTVLTFFADTPRALAVTPDGLSTYVSSADPTKMAIYRIDNTRLLGDSLVASSTPLTLTDLAACAWNHRPAG